MLCGPTTRPVRSAAHLRPLPPSSLASLRRNFKINRQLPITISTRWSAILAACHYISNRNTVANRNLRKSLIQKEKTFSNRNKNGCFHIRDRRPHETHRNLTIHQSPLTNHAIRLLYSKPFPSHTNPMTATYDVICIGAGPTGLACAIEAKREGMKPLVLDKGCLCNSLYHYPVNMTFFTTPERMEIGDLPMTISGGKPNRAEALTYYRRAVEHYAIETRLYEKVLAVKGKDGDFLVTTQDDEADAVDSLGGRSLSSDIKPQEELGFRAFCVPVLFTGKPLRNCFLSLSHFTLRGIKWPTQLHYRKIPRSP